MFTLDVLIIWLSWSMWWVQASFWSPLDFINHKGCQRTYIYRGRHSVSLLMEMIWKSVLKAKTHIHKWMLHYVLSHSPAITNFHAWLGGWIDGWTLCWIQHLEWIQKTTWDTSLTLIHSSITKSCLLSKSIFGCVQNTNLNLLICLHKHFAHIIWNNLPNKEIG